MNWIDLVRDSWRAVMNAAMNIRILQIARDFLIS
jgi:hypothetical protein